VCHNCISAIATFIDELFVDDNQDGHGQRYRHRNWHQLWQRLQRQLFQRQLGYTYCHGCERINLCRLDGYGVQQRNGQCDGHYDVHGDLQS
jgi:hypothetical protein